MTYQLAKQLKDAGYPQDGGCGVYLDETKEQFFGRAYQQIPEPFTVIPTLSELIDACGDRFGVLIRYTNAWKVYDVKADIAVMNGDPETQGIAVTGETPEEAVAKLYLKLHEKDKG